MEHVEHQVRLILGTALGERDPSKYSALREAAAKKLVQEFLAVAEKQGLPRGTSQHKEPYFAISDLTQVRVMTDGGGDIYLRKDDLGGGTSTPAKRVDLGFDCVTGTLMSKVVDDEIAPTPGQPLPRVHPLVAIARAAAELLATKAR